MKHTTLTSCSTALLQIKAAFGGTAAGGSYYQFSATNTSPKTCAINGYPKLAFFAPNAAGGAGAGSSVEMSVTNSGASPTTLKLKTGATAEFLMTYTDVPVNGEGCSAVGSVNVTPPHQGESLPVAISFSPCGGVVKVQPFAQPGTENP